MCLGELGREIQCAAACRLRLLEIGVRCVEILIEEGAAIGHSAVGERISRIQLDRTLVKLSRELVGAPAVLMEKLPPSQVVLVRVDVGGRYLLDRFLLVLGEHHAQRGDDALRDLILNREHG